MWRGQRRLGNMIRILPESTMTMTELKESTTRGDRTWSCVVCGWVYAESAGMPAEGIPPGTPWEDVPASWTCPECGARKADFEMIPF